MSGKRFVILIIVGVLATSAIMYTLYFLTRQLDYVPPESNAAPAAYMVSMDRLPPDDVWRPEGLPYSPKADRPSAGDACRPPGHLPINGAST
jgi:hypothetical protein